MRHRSEGALFAWCGHSVTCLQRCAEPLANHRHVSTGGHCLAEGPAVGKGSSVDRLGRFGNDSSNGAPPN